MLIACILFYTILEETSMKTTLEKKNPLIEQLVPAAMKGETITTITVYLNQIEECFNLSKEGFYIHPINYDSRQGKCELKVEWTHPIVRNSSVASKLLRISKVQKQ